MTVPQNWRELRIGDLGTVVTGGTPSEGDGARFVGTWPFITPTDLMDGVRTPLITRFISDNAAATLSRRILPPRSVCFTCIGATIGKACLTREPSITNQQINSVVVDGSQHNSAFVYYRLIADRDQIKAMAGGAATPIISKSAFENIVVKMPPLRTQEKIAAILSAYDELLENNQRRIKLLEEMVQRIYHEWFVDFRYPGHEGGTWVDSELGEIPQRWSVKRMVEVADVIDCLHSTKPKSAQDGTGILLQLFNIGSGGCLDLTQTFRISAVDYEQWTSRIELSQGDCVVTNVGRIAAVAQIPAGLKAAPGRNMTAIRPRAVPPTYLLQYLLSEHMDHEVQRKKDAGSIMDALNVKGIVKLAVPVPSNALANRFEQLARPIRRQMELLIARQQNLRATRDLLLPRLISADIDVTDLDIAVPEIAA